VGVGNAITNVYLVVYYLHRLVHPSCQGKGDDQKMMETMLSIYKEFHQQLLTEDSKVIEFDKKWVLSGQEKQSPCWFILARSTDT
jgi:hypothetical protein